MDSTVWTRYANKITVNPQAFQDPIPGFPEKKTHRNVRISLASQDPIPGFPEKKLIGTYVLPWLPRTQSLASQEINPALPGRNPWLPRKKPPTQKKKNLTETQASSYGERVYTTEKYTIFEKYASVHTSSTFVVFDCCGTFDNMTKSTITSQTTLHIVTQHT